MAISYQRSAVAIIGDQRAQNQRDSFTLQLSRDPVQAVAITVHRLLECRTVPGDGVFSDHCPHQRDHILVNSRFAGGGATVVETSNQLIGSSVSEPTEQCGESFGVEQKLPFFHLA